LSRWANGDFWRRTQLHRVSQLVSQLWNVSGQVSMMGFCERSNDSSNLISAGHLFKTRVTLSRSMFSVPCSPAETCLLGTGPGCTASWSLASCHRIADWSGFASPPSCSAECNCRCSGFLGSDPCNQNQRLGSFSWPMLAIMMDPKKTCSLLSAIPQLAQETTKLDQCRRIFDGITNWGGWCIGNFRGKYLGGTRLKQTADYADWVFSSWFTVSVCKRLDRRQTFKCIAPTSFRILIYSTLMTTFPSCIRPLPLAQLR
jgi:hypothetical protein